VPFPDLGLMGRMLGVVPQRVWAKQEIEKG
jgi:hypothetical protein